MTLSFSHYVLCPKIPPKFLSVFDGLVASMLAMHVGDLGLIPCASAEVDSPFHLL